jgi:lysophospholipase L1-like esterase
MNVHSRCARALVGVAVSSLAVPALAVSALAVPARSAQRAIPPSSEAVTRGSDYLALGDSITFGFRDPSTTPTPNYFLASSFIGYPEDVGAALGLHVANAACPGETSLSLIQPAVQSNDCENLLGGGLGYRSTYPLHVRYSGTQLQFALAYLRGHPQTRLVTLMIGANDEVLCQKATTDQCASPNELAGVLARVASDVGTTLGAIRHRAHYGGQIVVVSYFSLDYSSEADDTQSLALNTSTDDVARRFGATIADGYGVLEAAAAQSGGSSCAAGLLTELSGGGCGAHPSLAGQALLALAVEQAVRR